jgi:hypothetical protein
MAHDRFKQSVNSRFSKMRARAQDQCWVDVRFFKIGAEVGPE